MPIRSILDERFEQGLEQGLEQMTVSLLLAKFGDDDHLIELARSLLPLGPEQIVERVNAAGTLDDLT